jgi:cephalosporin-C deacetylase
VPYTDLPLDELRAYQPALDPPDDLAGFWTSTLDEARSHDLAATFTPVETALTLIDTYDVTFAGFGGDTIRAWLRLPTGTTAPLPALVQYVGYGGGRGLAHEGLTWAAAGYAHLVMDTRGQGGTWGPGGTPDPRKSGDPQHDGLMTDGIQSPHTYYYRRLIADAVRAVDAVRAHPLVDPRRVAVTGRSQGGGLAIAVAGLVPDLAAAMPDVPFLSDFPRAIRIADSQPYAQVAGYLKVHRHRVGQVERTLSYVDAAILGRTAKVPALFSVGLMDTVCPPSTVYAAYNWYGGPKEIIEYPFNDHEGGGEVHEAAMLAWLGERLRRTARS